MAVLSNWHGALHRILEARGIREFFDRVLISSEVGWSKPHPAIFRTALEELDLQPEETVHVGDSVTEDVEGALAVGMRALLIPRRAGGTSPGEPSKAPSGRREPGNGVEALPDFAHLPARLDNGWPPAGQS